MTSWTSAHAQDDANRTKIELVVSFGGKTIRTELNSFSFSLSRYLTEDSATSAKGGDSARKATDYYRQNTTLLAMDIKRINDDLLRVFSKKANRFDGTVTITDNFGKIPPRTIAFKQASLNNYSDQFTAAGYSDYYGASAVSFSCQEVSINGIPIE